MKECTQLPRWQLNVQKVVSNVNSNWSSEVAYAYYNLLTFAHVFHMHQRKVLDDDGQAGCGG